MKTYTVRSTAPAEDSFTGWLNEAYYTANGYMGICVFGDPCRNRIQLTEKTLYNNMGKYYKSRYCPGLEPMCDIYIDACNEDYDGYRREMCLNTGILRDEFTSFGIKWEREYFASYPSRVVCARIKTDKPASFRVRILPPPDRENLTAGDGFGRKSKQEYEDGFLRMTGCLTSTAAKYECVVSVKTNGTQYGDISGINVTASTEAVIYISCGTNYTLREDIFIPEKSDEITRLKALNESLPLPHDELTEAITAAKKRSCDELKTEHIADFSHYFERMYFDLGKNDDMRDTAELLRAARNGQYEPYLYELAFQTGRYMMICSSREGYTPSNLQAAWSARCNPAWCCGIWYNENEQMNYFPVFITNLAELFVPYAEFNRVRMKAAQKEAARNVKEYYPENYAEGDGANGWIVGTSNTTYVFGKTGAHSGPGTGGYTTVSYADWYEFTHDKAALVKYIYPTIEGLARFYVKCVHKTEDGFYLCKHSFSPEQQHPAGHGYETVGSAFDQQMIYENNRALLDIYDAEKENLPDADLELIETVRRQIDLYDGVQIGADGQIKEYREEAHYGEIGEKHHRHISQLLGLYPGKQINESTPRALKAAYKTLLLRGLFEKNKSWSVAHKLCMVARCLKGEEAYELLKLLVGRHVTDSLWTDHENIDEAESAEVIHTFQCDSNFGLTAGVAEMLVQSHGGYIKLLPAIPKEWCRGRVKGIRARGGFELDFTWKNGCAESAEILSDVGEKCKIYSETMPRVLCGGKSVTCEFCNGVVSFDTKKGACYNIEF